MTFLKDRKIAYSVLLLAFILAIIVGQLRKEPYVLKDQQIKIEREAAREAAREQALRERIAEEDKATDDSTDTFEIVVPGTSDTPIEYVQGIFADMKDSTKIALVVLLIIFLSKKAKKMR